MIKIIIADDVEIIRNGLKSIVEQDSEISVCATAQNGDEAYNLCKLYKPDLVLMDMQMPVCDGGKATQKIKNEFPDIKILVLTTFDDKETISSALASGADGYVLKGVDEITLTNAIKSTILGMNVLGNSVYNSLKDRFTINSKDDKIHLTPREKELMINVADGLSNKEIASKMFISDGTVRNNISALLLKLNLKDRTQLAVYAVKNDYV